MIHLFSIADVGETPESAVRNPEDVMMKIAVQIIECGIFIQQYMSDAGRQFDISLVVVLPAFDNYLFLVN